MRVTELQKEAIRQIVAAEAGERAEIRVFGSRARDDAKGGDLDLLVKLPEPVDSPALLSARLSARISRLMYGRKVDVLVEAPNLKRLPIHAVAEREGVAL